MKAKQLRRLINKLAICFLFTLSSNASSQDMQIKWRDQEGREFSVSAYRGAFGFQSIAGDTLGRDYQGRVSQVGNTKIEYDYAGRVSRIGEIRVVYDYQGRATRVGNLEIRYNWNNQVIGTVGSVR